MADDLADFNNLFSNMENTINDYNNNKNKYCDSACEREKRVVLLQKKYDFTNNIYTHGKDILWNLQKKLILEKSGSGSLNREVNTKAENHVSQIKNSLDNTGQKEFCPQQCTLYNPKEDYGNTFIQSSYFNNIRYLFQSPVMLTKKGTSLLVSLGNAPVSKASNYNTGFLQNGGAKNNFLSQMIKTSAEQIDKRQYYTQFVEEKYKEVSDMGNMKERVEDKEKYQLETYVKSETKVKYDWDEFLPSLEFNNTYTYTPPNISSIISSQKSNIERLKELNVTYKSSPDESLKSQIQDKTFEIQNKP